MVLAAVLLVLAGACGEGGKAATASNSTETTFGPDQVPHARLHVAYPFNLYVHCGVLDATFAGRDWVVVPPVTPAARPQPGYNDLFLHGTMTRTSATVAEFRSPEGLVARLRPRRPHEPMPSRDCI
jgi:hypothetical protein